MRQPRRRANSRQQLILQVEYDDASGFYSDFLSDLSEGGLRLGRELTVGDQLKIQLSFLDMVEPIQLNCVVRWTSAGDDDDGPASGLEFVDPSPGARQWIADLLQEGAREVAAREGPVNRVVLLEPQPFLRAIYSEEVRNWAELGEGPELDLVVAVDVASWLAQLAGGGITLTIVDLDEIDEDALGLLATLRADAAGRDLPVIALGASDKLARIAITDNRLLCLPKPLDFGVLMNTLRRIGHAARTEPPTGP